MHNKRHLIVVISFILIALYFNLPITKAAEYEDGGAFDGNFIVADYHFTDTMSMSLEQIASWLRQRGTLADYIDPKTKLSAPFIIYNAAQDYGISPKILLVLLQKEQSLVEDDSPTKNQYDWATGYSCYGGQCDEQYRGFSQQIRGAARRFMLSYWPELEKTGCTFTKWCVGVPKLSQDNIWIVPANKATAALYTYNPYRGNSTMNGLRIGANYNFWKIWQRWFAQSYPDGSLLKAKDSAKVYLIKNGQKRWIASYTTLATRYDANNIITVPTDELNGYPDGPDIKFPLYALVRTPNGSIYLIADDSKRMIVSWEVFRTIGFNPEEIEDISFSDLAGIPSGAPLTLYDAYPAGAVLQDKETNELYYVESGIKRRIADQAIIANRYPTYTSTLVSHKELLNYEESDPVTFRDGTLVKTVNDSSVYVISNGQRRLIPSAAIFDSYGYNWNNIVNTSTEALAIHPLGDPLTMFDNQ